MITAYAYLFYRWVFANLRWGVYAVGWNTCFWPAFGTILLQMFLTIITLGFYFPAAYVKLCCYFAGRTVLSREEQESVWGQTLLVLVTAGFYTPWAMARIGRWYAEHTFLESPAQPAAVADG